MKEHFCLIVMFIILNTPGSKLIRADTAVAMLGGSKIPVDTRVRIEKASIVVCVGCGFQRSDRVKEGGISPCQPQPVQSMSFQI